jgi:hypothetical protein
MPSWATPQEVLTDMKRVERKLTELGIADDYGSPVLRHRGGKVFVESEIPVDSSVLVDEPYASFYAKQLELGAFFLKLPDAALLQMSYQFSGRSLLTHRLAFLPSPDLTPFQDDPEMYVIGAQYLEIVGHQVMSVPMRFDFDVRPEVVSNNHPAAHLTLGQYANCRIPVSGPILPSVFADFIIRHFYASPITRPFDLLSDLALSFPTVISTIDESSTHLALFRTSA